MSVVKKRSFAFAVRIVKLYEHLIENKQEHIMSKQLLRSGTSIGAKIIESSQATDTEDIIHKLSIAQKECSETAYWLKLLQATNYLTEIEFKSIYLDNQRLMKNVSKIIVTNKEKNNTTKN